MKNTKKTEPTKHYESCTIQTGSVIYRCNLPQVNVSGLFYRFLDDLKGIQATDCRIWTKARVTLSM